MDKPAYAALGELAAEEVVFSAAQSDDVFCRFGGRCWGVSSEGRSKRGKSVED